MKRLRSFADGVSNQTLVEGDKLSVM